MEGDDCCLGASLSIEGLAAGGNLVQVGQGEVLLSIENLILAA